MIKSVINYFVKNFGFNDFSDFSSSFIRWDFLTLTIPVALISSVVNTYFGLSLLTLFAFVSLLVVELVTGITASKFKGHRIESRRFSRFGLKLFVWLIFFFIVQSMKQQYVDSNKLAFKLYDWLHDTVMIYVTMEYLISVLENISVISGDSKNKLTSALIDKILGVLIKKEDGKEK
jgi:hypothetical protein